MSPPVKGSRAYDSSGRQEQARETRRQVLAAATELFLERGYAATTMADVAGAAGVAVQTVYSSVGGKAELLKQVVDVAIVGDDEPVPVVQRPDIVAVQAETDGRRKLERFAAFLVTVQERTAALDAVLDVAAESDPTAAGVRDALDAGRRFGMREFATNLKEQRLLRRGVTVEKAAAVLVAHMDAAIYLSLVRDSGWSARDYQRWYVTVSAAALLPDAVQR
jgi:TetR/AcrR family transcriptional regulator, regulator of autoinduction and epiphytic fitness